MKEEVKDEVEVENTGSHEDDETINSESKFEYHSFNNARDRILNIAKRRRSIKTDHHQHQHRKTEIYHPTLVPYEDKRIAGVSSHQIFTYLTLYTHSILPLHNSKCIQLIKHKLNN